MRPRVIFAVAAAGAGALGWLFPASETPSPPAPALARAEPAEAPADGEAIIASIAPQSYVYAEPSTTSPRIGYLRAGAILPRGRQVAGAGCPAGFHAIAPRGFVCGGERVTLDRDHPVLAFTQDESPWLYVSSRYPPPPLYGRLPSAAEQRQYEPELDEWLARYEKIERSDDFVAPPAPDPLPPSLARGAPLPRLAGDTRGRGLRIGRARVRSSFALMATYDHDGRRFGLTTDLTLIPLDRTRIRTPSKLRGAVLEGRSLPIAIVTQEAARRYVPENDRLRRDGELARYQIVHLQSPLHKKRGYLEAEDGTFLRARDAVVIEGFRRAPEWAREGKKWIDVSILDQTLVAYEGTTPVFATLVSTGADGIAPARGTLATKQGTFLIHTKHRTTTMSDPSEGGYDLSEVPYVQYFHEGYALHGAYWHDDFGKPRSHGCINLSPADAAWLFAFTDPEVPTPWHGALSPEAGTTVHVHP